MRVADAAARTLCDLGVRRVYGYPGEDHMELLDAIAAAGIDYVVARSESAACLMAGVEADVGGRPAVAIVSMAPGITNAINGIANAYLDRLPLIVITGQLDRARLPLTVRQALDTQDVVRGVTKWRATAGGSIRQLLVKAFDVAAAPPSGPVHLEIPPEVAAAPAGSPSDWSIPERAAAPSAGTDARVERWHRSVRAARRPIAIVGHGARSAELAPALRRLTHELRVPVLTTPSAKGSVPDDDPWMAGTFVGGNLEAALIDRADLLIAIGLHGNDFLNRPWPYRMPILSLQSHPSSEGMLPVTAEIDGHLPTLIAALAPADAAAGSEWTPVEVAEHRDAVEDALAGPRAFTVLEGLRSIRTLVPRDTLVAVDAGFAKPFTAMLWRSYVPQSYVSSHGLSTMGYALPAANALKLLHADRVVIGFMGDGSMLMRATEIGVAAQMGLAPIYVVWMDDSMTQIAVKQARRDLRGVGTSLSPSSCASIAAAFGGVGYDVGTVADLGSAMQRALSADRPTMVGVHVDTSAARALFDLVRG